MHEGNRIESLSASSSAHERAHQFRAAFMSAYGLLHDLAAHALGRERAGHTLQPTALVHEAYLRLAESGELDPAQRTRFLATAALAIRRILTDHARRRLSVRRGGGRFGLALDESMAAAPQIDTDLLALNEALGRLSTLHPRAAKVVELRFFGGLTCEECAGLIGVSRKTATEDWAFARAWLSRQLSDLPCSESRT